MGDKEILGKTTLDELRILAGTKLSDGDIRLFENRPLSRVYTLDNQVQAQLVRQVLEQAGIPFMLKSNKDTAYDGLFTQTLGWGEVITLESDALRAQDTIRSVLEAQLEDTPEMSEDQG